MRVVEEFYQDQASKLEVFLEFPPESLRRIAVDEDKRRMLYRFLSGMESEPDNPHLLLFLDPPCDRPEEYFRKLREGVAEEYEQWEDELRQHGIQPSDPGRSDSGGQHQDLSQRRRFVEYVSSLAESMPDHLGSLALILAPSEIEDPEGFRHSMAYLSENTPSVWVKYLVPDDREEPLLEGIGEECDRADSQEFHLPPDRIEEGIRQDMESGGSSGNPAEHRRNLSMLASFAFSRRNYDEAKSLQLDHLRALDQGDEDPDPQEAALSLYNLGNTCLARNELVEAEANFSDSIQYSVEAEDTRIQQLSLSELGVCLYRQGRLEEGTEAFRTATRSESNRVG
jgi:tetratricopeptide (TPR) repeat protein